MSKTPEIDKAPILADINVFSAAFIQIVKEVAGTITFDVLKAHAADFATFEPTFSEQVQRQKGWYYDASIGSDEAAVIPISLAFVLEAILSGKYGVEFSMDALTQITAHFKRGRDSNKLDISDIELKQYGQGFTIDTITVGEKT